MWGREERIEYFFRTYPFAFHVSLCPDPCTIVSRGLLSAAGLLDACALPEVKRERLLRTQRKVVEPIQTAFGLVLLNDQAPLPAIALQKCLTGMHVSDWYAELSERIFFFLSEDKARAFAKVRENKLPVRTLFVFGTEVLTQAAGYDLDLCSFNSGNAMRKPVRRDRSSFQHISRYPLRERRRQYGMAGAAAEMSTRRRQLDIAAALVRTIAL